jgi:hypothetical protein
MMCPFAHICVYNLSDEDSCKKHIKDNHINCPHYSKVVQEYKDMIKKQSSPFNSAGMYRG